MWNVFKINCNICINRRCMHLGQIVKCKYEEPDRHLELHIAFRDKVYKFAS